MSLDVLSHVLTIIVCLLAVISGWFAIISVYEKEGRAARLAALFYLLLLAFGIFWLTVDFRGKEFLSAIFTILSLFLAFILLVPYRTRRIYPQYRKERIDERNTQFSRYFSSAQQKEGYYRENPDIKTIDDNFLAQPGLLSPGSRQFNSLVFASAEATARMIHALRFENVGEVVSQKEQPEINRIRAYIVKWAAKMGALDSGYCELKQEHFYTLRGRHEFYGEPVSSGHKHAIAFLVEMDREFVSTAPHAPVILESFREYLDVGLIALQVADFLRTLGWEAKAHIDSNYEVICPLVARDAGLGEIGRMGILMSEKTGPRCRISVVTTTAPLTPSVVKRDPNIIYFCERCRKCVHCCPSQSIPDGTYNRNPDTAGWKIDSDKCFSLWCKEGTDCARCMAVCPFSHDNSLLHRLVRRGISNSVIFARFSLWMDDLFYGKQPGSKPLPDWMKPLKI